MNRSGALLAARTRASASERATSVAWRGANFFSAEAMATASASYSSMRRTLRCGAVPAGDGSEEGTSATTQEHENRKGAWACQSKGGAELEPPPADRDSFIRSAAPRLDRALRPGRPDRGRTRCLSPSKPPARQMPTRREKSSQPSASVRANLHRSRRE